ncbi:SCO2400 family protein [Streptomyces sp. CA-135486]|uniref:SCO2400 family protein n=1 Tax=Streptomyces sp. CA-135486 TaxID=3240049 RepID=UPI003D943E90
MDYCHQCRRHLNGALACAGCGTPVEELRHLSPSAPAADHVYELDEVSEPVGHRRSRRQPPSRRKPPAGRRGRKRRGRKVLFGTVGLVLAAGALCLAELALENPGDEGAATAVREDPSVETEPPPEPTDDDVTPPGPDEVTEPAVTSSSSAHPTSTGSGKGPGGSGSGKRRAGGPVGGGPSAAPSAGEPSSSAEPSTTGRPSTTGTADPSQPPPQPTPTPTPTETCNQFLFWCI